MVVNKKVNKVSKLVDVFFEETAFVEVLYVLPIISSHVITE